MHAKEYYITCNSIVKTGIEPPYRQQTTESESFKYLKTMNPKKLNNPQNINNQLSNSLSPNCPLTVEKQSKKGILEYSYLFTDPGYAKKKKKKMFVFHQKLVHFMTNILNKFNFFFL